MEDCSPGVLIDESYGMTDETKSKFGKMFKDMVQLEDELELYRKQKLRVLAKDVYDAIDTDRKGFCTLQNY